MPYIGQKPLDSVTVKDIDGQRFILDADADTSITADTDDQIDIEVAGADVLQVKNSSGDAIIKAAVDAKDILFQQYDGRTLLDINDGGYVAISNGATGAGQLRLYEDTDNGTNYSAFQVGTQSGDVTYTLPTADGTSGQALTTNGSGTLSWATAGGSDPSSADGDSLGTASAEWSDLYLADGGIIYFGNDQEITLTHSADSGLLLKHTATADDKPINLTLQTGETDMAANDVIGKISFQAPDEGTGTDAVLVAAAIQAVSEGDFSSSANATKLDFMTGVSEAAATKMSLSSGGNITLVDGATLGNATTSDLFSFDAGETVFNESHADIDLRIEFDTGSTTDHAVFNAGSHALQIEQSTGATGNAFQATATGATTTAAGGFTQSSANATFSALQIAANSNADTHTGMALYIASLGKGSAESASALFINKGTNTGVTKPVFYAVNGHTNDIPSMMQLHHSPTTNSEDAMILLDTRAPSGTGFRFLQCVTSSAGTADTEFNLRGDGNAFADGTWSASGADYAEYFESSTGNQIPSGTTVVLDGNNKVRASKSDDAASAILGVIRPKTNGRNMAVTSCIVGNAAWNHWQGRYLTDDFGQFVLEDCVAVGWSEKDGKTLGPGDLEDIDHHCFKDELWQGTLIEKGGTDGSGTNAGDNIVLNGTDASGADAGDKVDIGYIVKYTSDGAPVGNNPGGRTITGIEFQYEELPEKRKKANSNYDPSEAYIPREERDEWVVVGMLGQVPVLKNEKTGDRWIKMRDISSETEEWLIR